MLFSLLALLETLTRILANTFFLIKPKKLGNTKLYSSFFFGFWGVRFATPVVTPPTPEAYQVVKICHTTITRTMAPPHSLSPVCHFQYADTHPMKAFFFF